jgi:hypothetical protein
MQPRFQCYRRDGQVWWRLLGRNNRSIGRSIQGFADLESALADAVAVADRAVDAAVEFVSDLGTAWRWVLVVDGDPRATSAAGYGRRLECVRAVARFKQSVTGASIADEPMVIHRRLRSATRLSVEPR